MKFSVVSFLFFATAVLGISVSQQSEDHVLAVRADCTGCRRDNCDSSNRGSYSSECVNFGCCKK